MAAYSFHKLPKTLSKLFTFKNLPNQKTKLNQIHTTTELKYIWIKYITYKKLKITSSFGIYNTIYYIVSFLLLFGKKKRLNFKFQTNNWRHLENCFVSTKIADQIFRKLFIQFCCVTSNYMKYYFSRKYYETFFKCVVETRWNNNNITFYWSSALLVKSHSLSFFLYVYQAQFLQKYQNLGLKYKSIANINQNLT